MLASVLRIFMQGILSPRDARSCRREYVAAIDCRHETGDAAGTLAVYLDVKVTGGWTIHHVQLACPPGTEDTLRGFYAGVLGFQELAKPPALAARGGCWFGGHGIELHLGTEHDFRPARKAHPGLLVDDLDTWADRLRGAGAPVLFDDGFPGMRRFYTEDPHGNRLEFLETIDKN